MKQILVLLSIVFYQVANAQIITSSYSINTSETVYNKNTGQRLSEEEMISLFQKYPDIFLEREYNKHGELVRLLFDPNNIVTGATMNRNENARKKAGELFPEFVFKTVNGEKIKSEELLGSWVLLRFELFTKVIDVSKLYVLGKQIVEFNNTSKKKLTGVIVFNETEKKVKELFNTNEYDFKLVPNGRNFHEMFNIVRFPTTVILNDKGEVFKNYESSVPINFEELLKK